MTTQLEWHARALATAPGGEVISGFRVGVPGMAGHAGIAPDLACYGKVIGGVYLPPSGYEVCFLSMAHDHDTLEFAAGALAAAAEAAARP